MTLKTRYFAKMGDIAGIELSCKKCLASTVLNPMKIGSITGAPPGCPYCNEPWVTSGSELERRLHGLFIGIHYLLTGLDGAKFDLVLQLEGSREGVKESNG